MTYPQLSFEFDPGKAASNLKKHGVSFDEAATVFADPLSSTLPDDQHSEDDDRLIIVGLSASQRLLFVVYTEDDSHIRIIGARLVTAVEKQQYEQS
jgi:uncharacterized protein